MGWMPRGISWLRVSILIAIASLMSGGLIFSGKYGQYLLFAQAWYNGKICTIIKRSKEEFDGLTIKICTIKTQSGQILEVPENHITVL
jgi:hypothetical protein